MIVWLVQHPLLWDAVYAFSTKEVAKQYIKQTYPNHTQIPNERVWVLNGNDKVYLHKIPVFDNPELLGQK